MQLPREQVACFSLIGLSCSIKFLSIFNFLALIAALHFFLGPFVLIHLLSGPDLFFQSIRILHKLILSLCVLSLSADGYLTESFH